MLMRRSANQPSNGFRRTVTAAPAAPAVESFTIRSFQHEIDELRERSGITEGRRVTTSHRQRPPVHEPTGEAIREDRRGGSRRGRNAPAAGGRTAPAGRLDVPDAVAAGTRPVLLR
ncbi:hypothetical protein Plo01_55650 [Planobispora longispora]|uniref:Uncharacterized protein n=1 Tax=Planobispora longispora TaxID=28887 RepID=A0A8J3RM57_9ACTN|nr:hypothetical protein Plo01_55650 [Planobispora longispora]